MDVRLERKLRPIRIIRGYQGDPGVFSQRNVVLQLEAKDFRVEAKRLLLVIYRDAGQGDSHCSMPSAIEFEVFSSVVPII